VNTLAVVVGVGARTSVGLTARHTAFLLRTGAAGFHEVPLIDVNEEPVTFGSQPTLDPLLVGADRVGKLAGPALDEALSGLGEAAATSRVHVVLGVAEHLGQKAGTAASPGDGLALDIGHRLRTQVAAVTVELVARGEASAGLRLTAACEKLAKGEADVVLVGGSHSDYEPAIIQRLSSLDRLFGAGNINGVIPGELAAFVALTTPAFARRHALAERARLHSVGMGFEKAGPDNDEPAFEALGLTQALKAATAAMESDHLKAGWMLTDMTAETHRVHEWQCAFVRTQKYLCEPQWIDWPAHKLGRLGAAALPLHVALVATAWRHGFGPHALALSTVGSDSGERVATLWSDATGGSSA
jgi:3-oxoacyl-[acyl-carrier-protein] synthase-1